MSSDNDPTPMTGNCPNCGWPVGEVDTFCSECGIALGPDSRATGPDNRQRGGDDGPGIPRKDAAETYGQALEWIRGLPVLVGAFALVFLSDPAGEAAGSVLAAAGVGGVAIGVVSAGFGLAGLLFWLIVAGVAHSYTDRLVSGAQVQGSVGELLDVTTGVARRLPSLLGVLLAYSVAVTVGFVLLVVPGLYLSVRLLLAFPACVIDGKGVVESLSTSWEVAGDSLLKLGGLVGLLFLAMFAALLALVAVLGVPALVLGELSLLESLSQVLAVPLTAVLFGAHQLAIARVYLEEPPRPAAPRPAAG
jgi:hypothetical protein